MISNCYIVKDLPCKHESSCDFLHGFRAKMASGGDNGNLVQDFEEAFQVLFKLHILVEPAKYLKLIVVEKDSNYL